MWRFGSSEVVVGKIGRRSTLILQAWGMTETSPLAAIAHVKSAEADLDEEAKSEIRSSVGTIVPTVEFRICEPDSIEELPGRVNQVGNFRCEDPYYRRVLQEA